MKILGLVVEYNPFHNGHLYHLLESKKLTNSTHTIAVMSGHFLQRGEPALFDKWTRAQIAVECGVDLVLEIPSLYATQSAEFFSHGSISTLNSLNIVDSICFGSEIGEVKPLYEIANILVHEPKEFKSYLRKYLDEGFLFPTARSKSLFKYLKNNNLLSTSEDELLNILNSSNNILGIEYIKSIIKLKSNITPYTLKRVKSEYNSTTIEEEICSATAIRELLKSQLDLKTLNTVVPKNSYNIIKNQIQNNLNPVFDHNFYYLIVSSILRDESNLTDFFEINEGIENKIKDLALKTTSLEDFIMNIKSKRYTLTKIKRMLTNILLGITKDDILKAKNTNKIPYIRILAFNNKGREIIKKIKINSDITIINNLSNLKVNKNEHLDLFLKYDIRSTNLYNLIYYRDRKNLLKGSMDYYSSPIYINDKNPV